MNASPGQQSAMVARFDVRGAKLHIFAVGERVISKKFGNHGEVIFRQGGRYRVRWDDGTESSGGFGGFDLRRER